jgi:hypothetical protein
MAPQQLPRIAGFIRGIAENVLRDQQALGGAQVTLLFELDSRTRRRSR